MRFDVAFATSVLNATVLHPLPDVAIHRVVIDSRRCIPGSLFVCLPGEKVDGHAFAAAAVQQGACAVLARRNPFEGEPPVPVLLVEDPAAALRTLAFEQRNRFERAGGTVIGLTGTAGKTTTKEMLSAVLGRKGTTSRTEGNFNNNIGLPLSILNSDPAARWWVIEAGISHPEDMDELGSLLRPDIALILNVGSGHTEGLGDRGTAFYKSILLNYLRPGGTALICADYPDLLREARAVRPDVVCFSCSDPSAHYGASYAGYSPSGKGTYNIRLAGTDLQVETPLHGSFAAENVAAVAAVAHLLGLTPSDIASGLEDVVLPAQRFALKQAGAWTLVDDSYNANPLSMTRMLDAASELAGNRPLVCILGAMGELGDIAATEHEKLGRHLAALQPAAIFWVGPCYRELLAGLSGQNATCPVSALSEPSALPEALAKLQLKEGVLLFKGSRFNRLERFITSFLESTRITNAL